MVVGETFEEFDWSLRLVESLEGLAGALEMSRRMRVVAALIVVVLAARKVVDETGPLIETPTVSVQAFEMLNARYGVQTGF